MFTNAAAVIIAWVDQLNPEVWAKHSEDPIWLTTVAEVNKQMYAMSELKL